MQNFFNRIVLLPLGSYEYHGALLPPDTDTIVATAVATEVAAKLRNRYGSDVILLPSLNYGISTEHLGLPNTMSVSPTTFLAFVNELADSLLERDFVVAINGHGGNTNALGLIEGSFNYRHSATKFFAPSLFSQTIKELARELFGEFEPHAGSVETSLVAHYLGMPFKEFQIVPPRQVRRMIRFFRTADLTKQGIIQKQPKVVCDPIRGAQIHHAIVNELTDSIESILKDVTDVIEHPPQ